MTSPGRDLFYAEHEAFRDTVRRFVEIEPGPGSDVKAIRTRAMRDAASPASRAERPR